MVVKEALFGCFDNYDVNCLIFWCSLKLCVQDALWQVRCIL